MIISIILCSYNKVVAEHALTVPVTKNLNANLRTFLPIHCVHQLLKSRVFTKYNIPVKDWLFKQILNCGQPVHPLLMEVLKVYVHAVVNTINVSKMAKQQKMSALDPFDEENVLAVFSTTNDDSCVGGSSAGTSHPATINYCDKMTTQILLMMFCLMYQNALLENMRTIGRKL